jgi:protoporphyrinogen oxidase
MKAVIIGACLTGFAAAIAMEVCGFEVVDKARAGGVASPPDPEDASWGES